MDFYHHITGFKPAALFMLYLQKTLDGSIYKTFVRLTTPLRGDVSGILIRTLQTLWEQLTL